jgi:hypothetical protein
VVWLVFNVAIALLLMMLGVFEALEKVLGFYAHLALAWVGAIVGDLVISKPLGLSPARIEFRRAYLHDVNPVGVGAMAAGSVLSVAAYAGVFGPNVGAGSTFIAIGVACAAAPLLASPPRQLLLQALAIAPTVRRPQQRHERHERSTSSPMSAWRYNWLAVRATALSLMGLATALRPELHEGSMTATGPAHATVRPKDAAGTRNGASSLGTSLLAPRGGGEAMRRGADGAPVPKDHEGLGLHCRSSLLQPRPRQPTVAE